MGNFMLFTNKVIKNYKAFAKFRAIKPNDSMLTGKTNKQKKKKQKNTQNFRTSSFLNHEIREKIHKENLIILKVIHQGHILETFN